MNRKLLPNDESEHVKDLLPGQKADSGQTVGDNRLFLETVWWIVRTGSPWPDPLSAFGNCVYDQYSP